MDAVTKYTGLMDAVAKCTGLTDAVANGPLRGWRERQRARHLRCIFYEREERVKKARAEAARAEAAREEAAREEAMRMEKERAQRAQMEAEKRAWEIVLEFAGRTVGRYVPGELAYPCCRTMLPTSVFVLTSVLDDAVCRTLIGRTLLTVVPIVTFEDATCGNTSPPRVLQRIATRIPGIAKSMQALVDWQNRKPGVKNIVGKSVTVHCATCTMTFTDGERNEWSREKWTMLYVGERNEWLIPY